MKLKEFVENAVNKIPHPSMWGEVCDLVESRVEKLAGKEQAAIASDYFCKLCHDKGYC